MIDASTKLCCLIGHPIAHSVSPQMHNAAFKALKLNYVYLAFDVEEDDLGRAVEGLKAIGAAGFNVTIPHKVSVIKFLDDLDESAEVVGAVNTVVIRDELARGYNTDVHGVEEALRGRTRAAKPALIIGAGGAARAAVAAVLKLGHGKIIIANRTVEKARELAGWVNSMGGEAEFCGLDEVGRAAAECGLIVNATSMGMHPRIDETPLRRWEIPGDSIVLDLVYNPLRTRLLREAEAAGAEAVSGLEVLVYQGARAFELWTGREAPTEVMREAALRCLEVTRCEG
ncbi:MAG: shikimate dehydrogenase [Nitrososphaeria archaeon]|nr:shikimate dehydrogenase [Nitrososphaeria archaeon]